MSETIIRGATDVSTREKVDLRTVRGLRSRLGGPSSRSSIRLGRRIWQGRDASTEAEIVLLFRFPVTIPRRKKQSLNSLIGSASILLMPATIAESWRQQPGSPVYCVNPTKEELQQGLKNVDRSSLITNKEKGTMAYRAVENADYQTQANAFRSLFNEKMKQ